MKKKSWYIHSFCLRLLCFVYRFEYKTLSTLSRFTRVPTTQPKYLTRWTEKICKELFVFERNEITRRIEWIFVNTYCKLNTEFSVLTVAGSKSWFLSLYCYSTYTWLKISTFFYLSSSYWIHFVILCRCFMRFHLILGYINSLCVTIQMNLGEVLLDQRLL